jgi:hypothetical protein
MSRLLIGLVAIAIIVILFSYNHDLVIEASKVDAH